MNTMVNTSRRNTILLAVIAAITLTVFAVLTVSAQEPRGVISGVNIDADTPGQATISWNAVTDAKDYRVTFAKSSEEYKTWSDSSGNRFPTTNSVTLTSLTEGETYKFMIRSRFEEEQNGSLSGPWSAEHTFTVAVSLPAAPTGLTISASSHDSVMLSWDEPGDDSITGYVVLRRNVDTQDPGIFTTIKSNTGSAATTYTDTTVSAETRYTYRVKAINPAGTGPQSNYVNVGTPAAPPAAPTGLSATTVSHDSVTLGWDDPSDDSITGYVVLRRNAKDKDPGVFTTIESNTGSSTTAYTDTTVSAETSYVFRVKAINPTGTSPQSNDIEVATSAQPQDTAGRQALTPQQATSTDATLSALTVDGTSVAGFDATRTFYQYGVASTVTQVTIGATTNHASATVAFSGTDADSSTSGHQVNLSAGSNSVTITVTAQDTTTTKTYRVSVNRGVDTNHGWKAADDFDTLAAAGNEGPVGIWSNGTTMWVPDSTDRKIYAYRLSTKARDSDKDFDTLDDAGNDLPRGIWSNGPTMWVVDIEDDKLYAYNLSTKARDSSKDFDTLSAAGNNDPVGIWSDGITMWVADYDDAKLYAYSMSTKARDSSKDFDTLDAANNNRPTGTWSNGTTMWVADDIDKKIYAYNLSTKARDASKDFDTLDDAGNDNPIGIWSNGATMWVADAPDAKLYSYNLHSSDATLSALTVDGTSVAGFDATRTSYQYGVANTVTQVTIGATTTHASAGISISGTDADPDTTGLQIALSPGANSVTVTVTAQDTTTTKTYRVSVNRGVDTNHGWKAADDFDTLATAGNDDPTTIWSNGTTMWVADSVDDKIYAYNLSTKARDSSKDFDTLDAAGNEDPTGIWSDRTTMWVTDEIDDKIYAYNLSTKARDSSKDFDTLDTAGNRDPFGIWSDGTTMWVADSTDGKIYAYSLSTKARDSDKDFDTLAAADNDNPTGIWSDGTTMWVADYVDNKLYAYSLSTKARDSGKDFDTLDAAGNRGAYGIWSDNTTLWVTDFVDDKLYSYNMTPSDDATLSALTVNGTSVAGFDADTTSYQHGVASTVTQVTIAATTTHASAAVAFSGTDADPNTTGRQVALSAGANSVTVTVTAQDTTTTKQYTLSINRGVTDNYGWKASDDFDTLAAANNNSPHGIWSNGTTMWVGESSSDDKIYAYSMSTKAQDSDKDFDTLDAADNDSPTGIWSNRTTMWVSDFADKKLYAYNLSTKARDSSKDFNTLSAAANDRPTGLWSDGTTMWVADSRFLKIYAYSMSTKARDASKDFNTLDAAGNQHPRGLWSDGTTMWVADRNDDKIYAYSLSTKTREASKDFNTLDAAGNQSAGGLWSDGITMWVADSDDGKVYSYNMPKSTDATLSGLTVDGTSVAGFDADRTSYQHGVASTVTQVTIAATANHAAATVGFSGTDADSSTSGHQVDLSAGRNSVTITVTAEDTTTTQTYTLSVNRGVSDDFGWKASDDFDTLDAAGNTAPLGIWSNGATMWVSDSDNVKLYAYNLSTRTRDSGKDFDTPDAAGNVEPVGIWSNRTTMWVSDYSGGKIYAYNLSTKARDSDKDFDTLDAAGNTVPTGIWSDSTTMWVADFTDGKIYAYNLSTKARDSSKDFDTLSAAGNADPYDIWSDGTTMWVADYVDDKIYAYNLSTKARESSKDFDTLDDAGNNEPVGIWSDGTTMWVSDLTDDKIYSYNLPGASDATLSALTVDGTSVAGFDSDRTSYQHGVASTITQVTIAATTNHASATVAFSGTDTDSSTSGHQVNLSAGRNEVTITVTAQDTTTTKAYTLSVNRGVTSVYGWKATDDLDTLVAAGNANPQGLWSDGTTMWVADYDDEKIYAYTLSTKAQDSSKEFDTLSAAGNDAPTDIWSDGTTMWVADDDDDKIYAYTMSTKARDSDKDFNTLAAADNEDPTGIWSDGTKMLVADSEDDKLYAYVLSTSQRIPSFDFDALIADNAAPYGFWSDGPTKWVADSDDDKIYAYALKTETHDSSKDFNTLGAAGNEGPAGIWSDGITMWVADSTDGKIYSYNQPSNDATLSDLTVDGTSVAGFDSDRNTYQHGVANTVTQVTIGATTTHASATLAFIGRDANSRSPGHQVNLSAGRNEVTITVTAPDTTTTKTYTLSVNGGVTTAYGWKVVDDFDTLTAAGNEGPAGIWSDGTTMWVANVGIDKLYAYNLSTKAHDSDKDFDTLNAAGNSFANGIWSDGTTMWVADLVDGKIYAYNLSTKARDQGKDFNTLAAAGNANPRDLWSDGTTMWVSDYTDAKIYAYSMSTKARESSKDFDTLDAAGNDRPVGIWSDSTTMWVADDIDKKIYAYSMSTKARESSKDFDTLDAASNDHPTGVWSDGTTMWVADTNDDKLYSYNMASASTDTRAPVLSTYTVSGTSLELTYDETLDQGSVPDKGQYTVSVSPRPATAVETTGVSIIGNIVTLTHSPTVEDIHTVRLSYRAPSTNAVQDQAGNSTASFSSRQITNNSPGPDVPGAPTGLTATPLGPNRIDLIWTPPTNHGGAALSGYRVEVSTDGTSWSDLEADTESTDTTHSHTGLELGNRRHYRVSAINRGGTSQPSNTASATTDNRPYLTFTARHIRTESLSTEVGTLRIPVYEVLIEASQPVMGIDNRWDGDDLRRYISNGTLHSWGTVANTRQGVPEHYTTWRLEVITHLPRIAGSNTITIAVPEGVVRDDLTGYLPNRLNRTQTPFRLVVDNLPSSDIKRPRARITYEPGHPADIVQDGKFRATVSFSEPVTGFEQNELRVSGATVESFTSNHSGSTYTATIKPNAPRNNETVSISISVANGVARDRAGHTNLGDSLGLLARPRPTVEIVIPKANPNPSTMSATDTAYIPESGWFFKSQSSAFEVVVKFSKPVTGFLQEELVVESYQQADAQCRRAGGASITGWSTRAGGRERVATITPSTTGIIAISVAAGVAKDSDDYLNLGDGKHYVYMSMPGSDDEQCRITDAP